jgi:hypothetical protein
MHFSKAFVAALVASVNIAAAAPVAADDIGGLIIRDPQYLNSKLSK